MNKKEFVLRGFRSEKADETGCRIFLKKCIQRVNPNEVNGSSIN